MPLLARFADTIWQGGPASYFSERSKLNMEIYDYPNDADKRQGFCLLQFVCLGVFEHIGARNRNRRSKILVKSVFDIGHLAIYRFQLSRCWAILECFDQVGARIRDLRAKCFETKLKEFVFGLEQVVLSHDRISCHISRCRTRPIATYRGIAPPEWVSLVSTRSNKTKRIVSCANVCIVFLSVKLFRISSQYHSTIFL